MLNNVILAASKACGNNLLRWIQCDGRGGLWSYFSCAQRARNLGRYAPVFGYLGIEDGKDAWTGYVASEASYCLRCSGFNALQFVVPEGGRFMASLQPAIYSWKDLSRMVDEVQENGVNGGSRVELSRLSSSVTGGLPW